MAIPSEDMFRQLKVCSCSSFKEAFVAAYNIILNAICIGGRRILQVSARGLKIVENELTETEPPEL
jgi:hypothetical protein